MINTRSFIPILLLTIFLSGCALFHEKPDTTGSTLFYPSLPQRPRLQFLCAISGENDLVKKPGAFREFIVGKSVYKSLGRPYDVCASKGKIYVLDRMYRKIVVMDLEKKTLSFLNDQGEGRLENPSGIFVSETDLKYIADMNRKQVVVFDENDHFLKVYGGDDLFKRPVDVAVFGSRVYIIDIEKNQLFVMEKDTGALVKVIGEKGVFFKPSHLTVGPDGDVFVNDAFDFRVKKYSPQGTPEGTIGFHGDQVGGFARPKGVAVDRNGNLYVVDAAFENVQIFNDQGKLLLFFGGAGNEPGKMYLPSGIAIDYENVGHFSAFVDPNFKVEYLIYVANMYGDKKLNVYGFGHWIMEDN